jgi:hypothetical protein
MSAEQLHGGRHELSPALGPGHGDRSTVSTGDFNGVIGIAEVTIDLVEERPEHGITGARKLIRQTPICPDVDQRHRLLNLRGDAGQRLVSAAAVLLSADVDAREPASPVKACLFEPRLASSCLLLVRRQPERQGVDSCRLQSLRLAIGIRRIKGGDDFDIALRVVPEPVGYGVNSLDTRPVIREDPMKRQQHVALSCVVGPDKRAERVEVQHEALDRAEVLD